MKKRYILIIIIVIFIFCIGFTFYGYNKNSETTYESNLLEQNEEKDNARTIDNNTEDNKIESIKEDLGYNNLDNQMYEIKKEYDGREVISIKPDMQYKVAIAGAIKNEKPDFTEVDKILEQVPNKSGIWITKDSREKFLNILKQVSTVKYDIDENGFLNQEFIDNANKIDENIKKINDGKKLFAIDIDKKTYLVDEVTGKIEEYPYEEMDPESPYECFETENASLYIITSNTYKKLNYKYVLEEVFK